MRGMTPDQYLELVAKRLQDGGAEVSSEDVGGTTVLVGYRPRFRLAWMATRLHLFTVVAPVQTVTLDGLTRFTQDALTYAIKRKGRLRGLQTGVAAIPVMVGVAVEPAAAAYAQHQLLKRWSAFAWPAAVDLSSRRSFRHEGRVVVGGLYANWMRTQSELATPEPSD